MFGHRAADQIKALGPILDADHVTDAHLIAWNVESLAVDGDMTVADHLPRLRPALAKAESMHHVVEAPLEDCHERIASVAFALHCLVEVLTELALQHAIIVLHLLFFSQVLAVVGELSASSLLLARWILPALDRALGRIAARSLEKQLQ